MECISKSIVLSFSPVKFEASLFNVWYQKLEFLKEKNKYFVQGFIKYLDQGWHTFSVKGQMVKIFSQVYVATSPFCRCENTAIDNTQYST